MFALYEVFMACRHSRVSTVEKKMRWKRLMRAEKADSHYRKMMQPAQINIKVSVLRVRMRCCSCSTGTST